MRTLRAQGTSIATIARRLGISRPTVYAYLRRDTPPGPSRLLKNSVFDSAMGRSPGTIFSAQS
ncbi:MAG: helix-turn-helix domain-containing protein [Candidatus Entotheonellia bacterium]